MRRKTLFTPLLLLLLNGSISTYSEGGGYAGTGPAVVATATHTCPDTTAKPPAVNPHGGVTAIAMEIDAIVHLTFYKPLIDE